MISLNLTEKPDIKWNKRLLNSPMGNVYQTIEVSKFIKMTKGGKPVFLEFFDEKGEIIGQLLLSQYSLLDKNSSASKLLKKILGTKEVLFRWHYGPIIFNENRINEIYYKLQKFLLNKKVQVIGTENPFHNNFNFQWEKSFNTEKWATFLIDLTKPKDNIWNEMNKHSVRKNIQRSQTRGVEVHEMQSSDLPYYFEMLKETKRKIGSETTYKELRNLWDIFSPIGMTGFLAYKAKQVVGGIIISSFNGYINEWGVARSKLDTAKKLYSQDYIKWKIIEWGIEKGCKYFDLTGVNPNPTSSKEKGILRFKKKFGGKMVEYDVIKL